MPTLGLRPNALPPPPTPRWASSRRRPTGEVKPDLLLFDLSLPNASGLDVLREIREAGGVTSRFDPALPVIVISGQGFDEDRVRGLERGAEDFLVKPSSTGSSSRSCARLV